MPLTAAIVDDLRQALGAGVVDAILRGTRQGRPMFYAAEVGADGQLREWGRAPSGQRGVVVDGVVVLADGGRAAGHGKGVL